jgi:catechol 2,3-dioxygenase-like lactoylglutathione lyase family enzyme
MQILGVDRAVLGVEDMSASQRFLTEFGLSVSEQSSSGATFTTRDGSEVALRESADAGLPAALTGGATIREIVWGVASKNDLERIGRELERDRPARVDELGTLRSTDDDGYAIAFRVTQRRAFKVGVNQLNIFGSQPNRAANVRVDFSAPIEPYTIGHIVLFTPDVDRAARFYIDRLGFRVTDSFKGGFGTFLRAAGSSDHHTLFLIRRPEKGLHHISYHVTDFNEVLLGGKRMIDRGWKTAFGPGRHTLGSNYFWYLQTPCGGAMEYAADMDRADENWKAGEWDYRPDVVAAYSFALPEPTK